MTRVGSPKHAVNFVKTCVREKRSVATLKPHLAAELCGAVYPQHECRVHICNAAAHTTVYQKTCT